VEWLRSILAACKSPCGEVTPNSTMMLEAPQRPLPSEMTLVVVTVMVCDQLPLFFLFIFSLPSSLNSMLTLKKIRFVLLFYDISYLILNVLIFNFSSWPFYQILICFQFHSYIHDLIFIFIFKSGPHSLNLYFFLFFYEFDFSF